MTYGITGNPTKEAVWTPIAALTRWLYRKGLPFRLHRTIADGLCSRGKCDEAFAAEFATDDPADGVDVLLSFGGDGSLLRSAHLIGDRGVPILGVNAGRLGFLSVVEIGEVEEAVQALEAGAYRVEDRAALMLEIEGAEPRLPRWALNDIVIDKTGTASMIAIEAEVDGKPLNTYWADGLIVATPTGATAYSLSVGGPILTPGSGVVVVTPIAPHTLTARPIVLHDSVEIALRVTTRGHPYVLAVDGISAVVEASDVTLRVRRAPHKVRLVQFAERDYFSTIREKLMWGQGAVFEVDGEDE
ncbi:MAG TPA: NAD(+)/NADH kinase [Rhodothermales bacterium]|nr:NAD(+)/NADH kinase [Rhodothermales bacterium]